ncbi:MAG: Gfo/Idh/MocA family oxidoreductase [Armatimonadetes bacterium]|nr:Gfo/Idh/MocA family oxidoreductase [Armatimonadota bacterium]
MAKYRAVIIGCGGRSFWHARAYGQVENADVVACCDLVEERRNRLAEAHGLKTYNDPRRMIEQERPDLVHLVTSPRHRVELLRMIGEMSVPACLVEKPIALGASDWRQICKLESETRTKIGVGAQWRYSPYMERCREALASGKLGKRLFMEATAMSSVCDQGVHVLDWAMSLNDESPAALAFGTVHGADEMASSQPGPRSAAAQLVFENGVGCSFTIGTTAPLVPTKYEAIGRYSHCRAAVYCERGRVLFEEFGRWEIVSPEGTESGETMSMTEWEQHNDRAQAALTRKMLAWIEDDSKPVGTNLKRALAQWNAILGVYASGVWGRPVELPFEPPDDLFEQTAAHLGRGAEASSSE